MFGTVCAASSLPNPMASKFGPVKNAVREKYKLELEFEKDN